MGTDSGVRTEDVVTTSELRDYYQIAGGQNATAADAVRILDAILNRDASEDLTVSEIRTSLSLLSSAVDKNTKEILNLNNLLASLIGELLVQGIEINNKELLNEFKQYYKNGYTG